MARVQMDVITQKSIWSENMLKLILLKLSFLPGKSPWRRKYSRVCKPKWVFLMKLNFVIYSPLAHANQFYVLRSDPFTWCLFLILFKKKNSDQIRIPLQASLMEDPKLLSRTRRVVIDTVITRKILTELSKGLQWSLKISKY